MVHNASQRKGHGSYRIWRYNVYGALPLMLCLVFTPVRLFAEIPQSDAKVTLTSTVTSDSLGADLKALLAWAERENRDVVAMALEATAQEHVVAAADALPDPSARVELQDMARENPTLSPTNVGSTKYTVMQMFPWWGTRALRREQAESEHARAVSDWQVQRRLLRQQVMRLYARRYFLAQAQQINQELVALSEQLEQVALRRYQSGPGAAPDVLNAQLERTARIAERISLDSKLKQATRQLNALLARPPMVDLAIPPSLPSVHLPGQGWDAVRQKLTESNPQLRSESAMIEAAQQNLRLVEKERYPNVSVGLSQIQRESRLDAFEVMVEASLPIRLGLRDAREAEARARSAVSQTRRQALQDQLLGELGMAWAAFEEIDQQIALREGTLIPQAEATYRTALAGYNAGTTSFTTLLESQRQWQSLRIDLIRSQYERFNQFAVIEQLLGEDLL